MAGLSKAAFLKTDLEAALPDPDARVGRRKRARQREQEREKEELHAEKAPRTSRSWVEADRRATKLPTAGDEGEPGREDRPAKGQKFGAAADSGVGKKKSKSGRSTPNTVCGKKKKLCDTSTVWTFSGSGWGTIEEKLGEKVQGTLQRYAVQEHHLAEDKWPVVTQCMNAQAAAWVSVGKGVVIASIDLWTATGMSYRKRELLTHVVEQLQTLGVPWIVGGGFQAQLAGIRAQEGWPPTLRKPVGIAIKLTVVERNVRLVEGPKPVPELQIGCASAPPRYEQVVGFISEEVANQEWAKYIRARTASACRLVWAFCLARRARDPALPARCGGGVSRAGDLGEYIRAFEKEAFAIRGMARAEKDPRAWRSEAPKWRITPLTFGGDSFSAAARQATWWRCPARSLRNLQGARQRLHATTEQWDMRTRERMQREKLFKIRNRRTKHLAAKGQGARQARCELLATRRRRNCAETGKLRELRSEAACKSKECHQQLVEGEAREVS
ncbi:unnamed protein product [Prorocentrum cordatum]|uniref:Uncharacterized protein n=1 Tax=Prorocentrum cordatum TaxID=2364126 RepID=A0ABN9XUV1_9DINO|nr:unnamed protein product [Polarella glacialis]